MISPLVGVIAVLASVMVIRSRDIVRAALYLIITFSAVGVLFLIARADFLGMMQILVYTGAVGVMMLLMVNLTKIEGSSIKRENRLIGGIISSIVFFVVALPALRINMVVNPTPSTKSVIAMFFHELLIPFEVISIVLLVALIGATYLLGGVKK